MYYKSFGEILKEEETFKLTNTCSLKPAKRLKELGIEQESSWYWELKNSFHSIYTLERTGEYSAFTVVELGTILSSYICKSIWNHNLRNNLCSNSTFSSDREADQRAKMLIWLIEDFWFIIDNYIDKLTEKELKGLYELEEDIDK